MQLPTRCNQYTCAQQVKVHLDLAGRHIDDLYDIHLLLDEDIIIQDRLYRLYWVLQEVH
jgi:hypothetical protein